MSDAPAARVLLVDDDAFIRRPLELFLLDQGFLTVTADHGDGCLESVRREAPSVIVMDVTMPGRDGFETCLALKEDPRTRDIPVILLTGRGEEQDRTRAREVGAVDLVTKPYSPEALIEQVRALIEQRDLDVLDDPQCAHEVPSLEADSDAPTADATRLSDNRPLTGTTATTSSSSATTSNVLKTRS